MWKFSLWWGLFYVQSPPSPSFPHKSDTIQTRTRQHKIFDESRYTHGIVFELGRFLYSPLRNAVKLKWIVIKWRRFWIVSLQQSSGFDIYSYQILSDLSFDARANALVCWSHAHKWLQWQKFFWNNLFMQSSIFMYWNFKRKSLQPFCGCKNGTDFKEILHQDRQQKKKSLLSPNIVIKDTISKNWQQSWNKAGIAFKLALNIWNLKTSCD